MSMERNYLLFAVPLVLFAAPGLYAAEPVDVLNNGGFENGTSGWTLDPGHRMATEPDQARTGKACLTGEVTAPDKHLSLRQQVQVKKGNRYQFEIWSRGTNQTKLVLFMRHGGKRESIAAWEKQSPKWRRYSALLPVQADGTIELEIISPSSHAAPAGKIWLDDVALLETAMPAVTSVSQDEGFNDEPTMTRADDGSLYVAWNSFRDGHDTLQIARYLCDGDNVQAAGQWQAAGGPDTHLLGPQLVTAGSQVYLVYAAERETNWDVYAMPCGTDGPGRPVSIDPSAGVDVNPAAAWRDGTLHVVWESNRNGRHQVFASSLTNGRSGEAVAVSSDQFSNYKPTVAVTSAGDVCVAWHSFRQNNYDVYCRRQLPDGSWMPETRLTQAAGVDRHAHLAARGEELWLAYENAQVEDYYVGRTNFRRIVVAKIQGTGLLAPKDYHDSPLWQRCEAPSLCFDRSDRLWVAYLRPRLPRAGWDTYLTCLDGDSWQTPLAVTSQKGLDRRPSLACVNDRLVVCFQSDSMPTSWSDVDLTPAAKSNISLATVLPENLPAAGAIRWEPLVEADEPFPAAELRVQRGEDMPTPRIEYNGQNLGLYFGDLHQHSDVSVCNRLGDQSIEEDYQFSRDLNRLDFACSTDHGYNINQYLWSYTAKLARVNDDPDRFLTFLAEEWTSSFEEYSPEHPFGYYGHRNLILGDTYFPRWWNARNRQTPADLWEDLRKLSVDFVNIPHQLADTGNVPTDWNFTDEQAQPVAEIFQVRGSYEYKGAPREAARSTRPGYFLQDAWARGIVIGVIASPDHGGGYGKACVFAPELTRKAILQGLRDRHCFGTTGARMFLDVRVDGHLMGEKVPRAPDGPVTVKMVAKCPMEIDRIEVCRNNRFIYTQNPEGRHADFTFVDMDPPEGRSYYYVRVVQEDEEIAWSSPVWFGTP